MQPTTDLPAASTAPANGNGSAAPRVTRIAPRGRGQTGLSLVGDAQLSIFSAQGATRAEWGIKRFRDAVWSYAAISQVATDIAGLPFKILRGPKKDDPEIDGGPLRDLLDRPNPDIGWADLLEAVIIYLECAGRAYVWMNSGNLAGLGTVRELWPLRSDRVIPVLGEPVGIKGYVWRSMSGDQPVAREAIVPFSYFDPIDPIGGGLSPLVPAQLSIDQGIQAGRWNAAYFAKGARPGLIVTTPNQLGDPEFERFKREIRENWTGADNAHVPLLLDAFAGELKDFQATHKDMTFTELLKATKQDQLAAIGEPPAMAGDFESLNLAQVEMQERIAWTKKRVPLCRRLEGVINRVLAPRVQPGAWFRFDLSGVKVLQEDEDAILERKVKRISFGLATPNEILKEEGAATYEGGDEHYVMTTLAPVRDPRAEPAPAAGDPAGAPMEPMPTRAAGAVSLVASRPPLLGAPRDVREAGSLPAPSDEREVLRTSAWRGFNSRLIDAERKLEDVWGDELDGLARFVVRKIRQRPPMSPERMVRADGSLPPLPLMIPLPDDPGTYLPDANALVRELTDKHGRVYRAVVARFGQGAVAAISASLAFDEGTPSVLTLVERDAERVGEEVIRLLDDLRDVLEGGLNAGETVADLTNRIKAKVGVTRAERIARTEALAAANSGTFEGYRQAGVEQHEWLSSRDQFVRDAHREADGQVANVGMAFDVGGEALLFPGDPQGSASQVVNCRCTTVPVVGEG